MVNKNDNISPSEEELAERIANCDGRSPEARQAAKDALEKLYRGCLTRFLARLADLAGKSECKELINETWERVCTALRQEVPVALPRERTEQRELTRFLGRLHRIEEQTAHISLEDPQGEIFDAECAAHGLTAAGVRPGQRFLCKVTEQGDAVHVTFEPWQRRRMSDKQWRRLKQETQKALGEDDPTDDY
jgi:hypothetical protein